MTASQKLLATLEHSNVKYNIEPYTHNDITAVREFNHRLSIAGIRYRFPDDPVPRWLPPKKNTSAHQEFYLVHDQMAVRGGYILKVQDFLLRGGLTKVGDFSLPLSEGLVDSSHAIVGLLTIKDALRRSPLLFGLGMGSYQEPVARLFKTLKFKLVSCPFFFRVNHPYRFFRNISFLRNNRSRAILLDGLAFSGLGWLGLRAAQQLRYDWLLGRISTKAERVHEFGPWCNKIWDDAHAAYSLIAVRDEAALRTLYPSAESRFIKVRITHHDSAIGWAVLLNTPMKGHQQFGNMQVGSIVDVLSLPGYESMVVRHATECLRSAGSDILVSNQLHKSWCQAFASSGYLQGPSNFIFAASPKLVSHLEPFAERVSEIHMTRGDGDGPINL